MSSDIQNISIEQSVLVALMTTSNSLEVVANDLTGGTFLRWTTQNHLSRHC